MNRIYLDWNILSYIRNCKKTDATYKAIYEIIIKNDKNILFPFSSCHLSDLKRSYKKSEKGKTETLIDLDFLELITKNHCLYYDLKNKNTIPIITSPKDYFYELIENDEINFDDLFSPFQDNDSLSEIWNLYLDLLKLIPSGIDFQQLDKIPDKYKKLKDFLPTTRQENNFYNLIKDTMNFLTNLDEGSNIYKSLRNVSIQEMKIETDPTKWNKNAFDYIDSILTKAKVNKSFQEFAELSLKSTNKELSRFDYFINYYISLDTFGFYKDSKLPNLIDDATHAYYGAYCDFFVTEDDNTYNKAKAVYEKFNIKTKVCKAQEFLIEYYRFNQIILKNQTIFEKIIDYLKYSFLLMQSVDNELNPAKIYKLDNFLVDYFNRMQITDNIDNTTSLFFYKRRQNYSNFLFWTEIETVVNKIVNEFGIDLNNRFLFDEIDKTEIKKNNWNGRFWKNSNMIMKIFEQDEPFGLTLQIDLMKN